ncbi:unnamed protein product [Paramecium sonneborni]|uniref:Uncharacterized protein n=1 Tax=Paramecium sonneborni TaxID=65129 RepID=A0A8S1MGS5_9CILI|nr:unnamed protein product [Paramecium sonneborni]
MARQLSQEEYIKKKEFQLFGKDLCQLQLELLQQPYDNQLHMIN